jgi:hypothetical protein
MEHAKIKKGPFGGPQVINKPPLIFEAGVRRLLRKIYKAKQIPMQIIVSSRTPSFISSDHLGRCNNRVRIHDPFDIII